MNEFGIIDGVQDDLLSSPQIDSYLPGATDDAPRCGIGDVRPCPGEPLNVVRQSRIFHGVRNFHLEELLLVLKYMLGDIGQVILRHCDRATAGLGLHHQIGHHGNYIALKALIGCDHRLSELLGDG